MKFLLTEDKFILNESSKFILEERFNLEEEILLEAQATLKQLVIDLNKLNTLLPDLLGVLPTGISLKILDGTVLEGEKLEIETEIQTKCTEVQDLLKTKKNFKELIDQIKAKAELPEGSFTEEEVKILQPLCYSIASDGNSVKDRLKGIKGHKGELAEQVATLQERLPKLKTGLENLYKFFEKDTPEEPTEEDPTDPIKYSLEPDNLELAVGDTAKIKLMATPKPDEPVRATFVSNNTKIVTVTNAGDVTAVSAGETQVKVTIEDKTLECSVVVTAAEDTPEETETTEATDWEDLYKKCTECINRKEAYAAFWKGGLPRKGEDNPKNLPLASSDKFAAGYFKGEWGKQADRIMSLGTTFINCLKEIGWSETLNPFIALLKHLCKFDTVHINDASFTQLRSLYGTKISEDNLRGKDKLEELDLVRNPLLYKQSGDAIADYLTWQHTLIAADKISEDTHEKVVYANIAAAIGNAENLEDATAYKTISDAKFVYEVRPLSQYKEIIKASFDIDGDKHKISPATDKDIEEILAKIKSPERAKKLLTYLVNLYRITGLGMLKNLFKEPFGSKLKTNRNTTSTSFEEDTEFDLLINTAVKKYSLAQLKTLCTKLMEIAKL